MVSIIIPMFNAEKSIYDCVESIEQQEYKDIEIIIVNDGSTDCSLEICESLSNKYSNIKIVSIPNGGVSKARNIGLKHANGKYIQFVDSDDMINFKYTSEMIKILLENEVDLVISSYTEVGIKENIVSYKNEGVFKYKDETFQQLLQTNRLINSPCNKLFIKEKICFEFLENLTLGEDLVFCLNYMEKCNACYYMNVPLYNYISHNGSLTSKFSKQKLHNLMRLDEVCCKQFGLSKKYFVNFVENIYDMFCIMSKDSSITDDIKEQYLKELCESKYLLERLKDSKVDLSFKHRVFVYLLRNKKKILLVLLLKVISRKKVILN